jgi:glyoxylase-like metal-dependent hydrolase (beta-lactamase superfamily II)
MKKAVIRQIDSNTWQFTEKLLGENVYCYLLQGKEKALLIDTAYGFTDIPKTISELTDKPLTVVNTHGHFDHISGNYLYENVYLNEKDRDLYRKHSQRKCIEKILETATDNPLLRKLVLLILNKPLSQIYSHPFPETSSLPECGYFELGDRKITIIETPGHTTGSISLLDDNNGWLFSADTCGNVGMLLHFPEGTSLKVYHETIKHIRNLVTEEKIKRNYPAHQTAPAPLEKLETYDRLLTRMEAGKINEEEWKKGLAVEEGITIQFDPERVRKEIS